MALERLAILVTVNGGQAVRELNKIGTTADRDLGKLEKGSEKAGAAFVGAGTKMVTGAALLGAGLWKAGQAASALNEQTTQTGAVFAGASKEIAEFAKGASSIGLSERAARQATGTFGLMFSNIGKSKDEAADMAITMTKLAADIASFKDISLDEATMAVRSGLAGEMEPVRKLGIDLSDLTLKQRAYDMQLTTSTTGVLPMHIKVQAAYAELMAQTGIIQGDVARTSGDYANTQRRLQAETENATASLGEGFLPVMKQIQSVGSGAAKGFSSLNESSNGLAGTIAATTVVAVGFTGALSLMAGAALKAKTNLAAMNQSAAGKWAGSATIAVTGLAVAYGIWSNAMQEAEGRAKSLGQTAADAFKGKGFAEGNDQIARIREQVRQIDADLANSSDWAFWDADYRREMEMTRNELVNQANAMEGMNQKARELAAAEGISVDEAKKKLGATKEVTDATKDSAGAAKDAADATKDQADALKDASDAAKDALDRFSELLGIERDSVAVQRDYEKSIRDSWKAFNDLKAEGGSAMDWTREQINTATEAGQALEDSLRNVVDNGFTGIDQAIQNGQLDVAKTKFDQLILQIMAMASEMGISKTATDKFLQSMGLTQEQWRLDLDSSQIDTANSKLEELRQRLNVLRPSATGGQTVYGSALGYYTGADAPRRAMGGPVTAGQPYVVGDGGKPELFVPGQSGTILPDAAAALGGGGVTIVVNGNVYGHEDLIDKVDQGLRQRARAIR